MKIIIFAIKTFVLLLLLGMFLLLCGCAKKPSVTENLANTAHQTIAAIQKDMPEECKTESNNIKFAIVDSLVDEIYQTCEIQKTSLVHDKIKWQSAFFALGLVFLAFLGRGILK